MPLRKLIKSFTVTEMISLPLRFKKLENLFRRPSHGIGVVEDGGHEVGTNELFLNSVKLILILEKTLYYFAEQIIHFVLYFCL